MSVPMPAVVVLIVCKTVIAGPADQNSDKTGWENRDWAYINSKMVCQRSEVKVEDVSLDGGIDASGKELPPAAAQPFNGPRCWSAAVRIGAQWDVDHRFSSYRTWRVACPVPMFSDLTGNGPSPDDPIVGWVLPDCGHKDTVVCDTDSVI